MGAEADLVKARFARGCRCYAVMIDGSIAGYGWLSTGPEWIGELQLEIRPAKAQGYIWNCVTVPEHRRTGVFKALVAGICDAARGLGITRLWIGTIAIPGESAIPKLGFRPAVRFSSRRFAGLLLHRRVVERDPVIGREALHLLGTSTGWYGGTIQRRRH